MAAILNNTNICNVLFFSINLVVFVADYMGK